ncbi:MAG: FAD-dependent oxidoreductase [Thiotrichales bacterium]|nr:FAD-dependent oxidoreductase [Thiotrichales bacterium]
MLNAAEQLPAEGAASRCYDVAIVGAGPVGSVCALAHARRGAHVALLEANPKAAERMAGEWLHPPAVRILRDLGIDLDALPRSATGNGFVVFPEDGSKPITLPYPSGSQGLVCEHALLVSTLREAIEDEAAIDFVDRARVKEVQDQRLTYSHNGALHTLNAARIVGADGRTSTVRRSLGLSTDPVHCSRMVGVTLTGVELPFEGHGHVLLGGPGPVLAYSVADGCVRIIIDVPLDCWAKRDRVGFLTESYADLMPEALRSKFVEAIRARQFHFAANQLRPRAAYGNQHRILIGDAAGHYHPMTAVGMTLGFGDALALAESKSFRDFTDRRLRDTHMPELLAMGLYEVFADCRAEAHALRHAVYLGWRTSDRYRDRTTRILACEDRSVVGMSLAFSGTAIRALAREVSLSRPPRLILHRFSTVFRALTVRIWWFMRGALQLRKVRAGRKEGEKSVRDSFARAFLHSMASERDASQPGQPKEVESSDAGPALRSAADRLLSLQDKDGGWEGEMVWCPMLTAQYVLLHHIVGRPLSPSRRRHVLRFFEQSRLGGGAWGMHEHSPPQLFVTALVYVAARSLGVEQDDPLVEPARRFIQAEGILGIPSWGKFWLALLNLYDWRGVNAILPELWGLPRWIPLHPSNWYCHTRLIYMAMAVVYSHRFQAPVTPLIASLREELFPQGFASTDFSTARGCLRKADLFARPSVWLKAGYGFARLFNRFHGERLRTRCTEEILRQIRWELRTTDHTSISPVSGLLNMLALWLHDPDDADFHQALARMDGWIWEDEEQGARVTGARSASWDSGFALQALAEIPAFDEARGALQRGADFLLREQIATSFDGFRDAYRSDPKGGWCFPGGWHGWPVSDCTAEAVLGIVAAGRGGSNPAALSEAARFMLRRQNRDGGFGSYEARRSRIGLEWLNPAEMFGESMTEHSFVECTGSCLAALSACREHMPEIADDMTTDTVSRAISRADFWLRRAQRKDGSWRGVWGIQFIYGTLFGIKGLLAAGARPSDPALRSACHWLLERQREDGGWGEHHSGCLTGRYVPHEESQVIQTAWALIALLEAEEPNWTAISRGAHFLLDMQRPDGTWPKQDMVGVFFRTALLDYVLYRQYFPLHALGLYEQRRQNRMENLATDAGSTTGTLPPRIELVSA